MKKKAEAKTEIQPFVDNPSKSPMQNLLDRRRQEREQEAREEIHKSCQRLNDHQWALTTKYRIAPEAVYPILTDAIDFQMVQEFGRGNDSEGYIEPGTERLHMSTSGNCMIETESTTRAVTLRESVQWMSEMHSRKIDSSSFDDDMIAEWLRRVAGEMR